MTDRQPIRDLAPVPRWLHRWAVATVCAALPLVLLGAEVTTRQVGMADPQSVRTPWYVFTVPVPELLERGHRLSTRCDTEAWVHLYEDLGEGMFAKARGQFAVSLWDRNSRTLIPSIR